MTRDIDETDVAMLRGHIASRDVEIERLREENEALNRAWAASQRLTETANKRIEELGQELYESREGIPHV